MANHIPTTAAVDIAIIEKAFSEDMILKNLFYY
jgi:hypothetical protein